MEETSLQAADVLPAPLVQGIFCEDHDQLFVALCTDPEGVENRTGAIRVYDVAALRGARTSVDLCGQKLSKLPLRWEWPSDEPVQSILAVEGKLIWAGERTVMQFDLEAGYTTPGFGEGLSWKERVTFPEPIFPPVVHEETVVVLTHGGNIYMFPRRTPPKDADLSVTYAHSGKVQRPPTLIGDRLVYQQDDHIVVFDVTLQKLVSRNRFADVQLNGKPVATELAKDLANIDLTQKIYDLDGYGFLPMSTTVDSRTGVYYGDIGSWVGGLFGGPCLYHLVPAILICPDGSLHLPMAGPYEDFDQTLEFFFFGRDLTYRGRHFTQKGVNRAPKHELGGVEALIYGADGARHALFPRTSDDAATLDFMRYGKSSQGGGGLPGLTWTYVSVQKGGAVKLSHSTADTPEALQDPRPFWRWNQAAGVFESTQLVPKKPSQFMQNAGYDVVLRKTCALPDCAQNEPGSDPVQAVVRGDGGRTMVFATIPAEVQGDHPFSGDNLLMLLPE